jgi:hypothetical protein
MVQDTVEEICRRILDTLSPESAIRLNYLRCHGRLPDLRNPRRFSEKIQYRKLYGDQPLFTRLADKLRVKDFVAETVGNDLVIPTLWSGATLPPRHERMWKLPFVIKANHGSGWNRFIRLEEDLDWKGIEADCTKWLMTDYKKYLGERWYDRIERKLLVEPIIGDNPRDYKFFVFGGKVQFIEVDTDRFSRHKRCFYDSRWNRLELSLGYPLETKSIAKPVHLTTMLDVAEKLAAAFDFVRVDLYDLDEGPKFSELTFTPDSGHKRFRPDRYDYIFGDLWPQAR